MSVTRFSVKKRKTQGAWTQTSTLTSFLLLLAHTLEVQELPLPSRLHLFNIPSHLFLNPDIKTKMNNNGDQNTNMSEPNQERQRRGAPTNYHPNASGPGYGFGFDPNFPHIQDQDSAPANGRSNREDGIPVSKSD
jgi:hypothetical protein